jgi:hypothetical protein
MSLQKKTPLVLQRKLAEHLRRRLASTLVVTETFDNSGNPVITVNDGTAATTEQNVFIRIVELAAIGTDSTGQAAQSYGPHVVQIAQENLTATTPSIVAGAQMSWLNAVNSAIVLQGAVLTGARVELYLETAGSAPTVSSIDPAKLVLTLDSSLMFGVYAGK